MPYSSRLLNPVPDHIMLIYLSFLQVTPPQIILSFPPKEMVRPIMLGSMLYISLIWWFLAHKVASVNIKNSTLCFPVIACPLDLLLLVASLTVVWVKERQQKNSNEFVSEIQSKLTFVLFVDSNHFISWALYRGLGNYLLYNHINCLDYHLLLICQKQASTLSYELQMYVWD